MTRDVALVVVVAVSFGGGCVVGAAVAIDAIWRLGKSVPKTTVVWVDPETEGEVHRMQVDCGVELPNGMKSWN